MPTQATHVERLNPMEHLRELQDLTGQCVSIYLPRNAGQKGPALFANQAKSALRRAGERLADEFGESAAKEWPPADLTALLQQLRTELRMEPEPGGIALFSCDGKTRMFQAPTEWPESLHVGNECYIRPLLPLLKHPPRYYLLALSENGVRLFLCTTEGAEEIRLPADIPGSLEDAMLFKAPDHRLEHGSASGPMPGQERGIRFGTTADDEKHNLYLRQFFSQVDASLRALLTSGRYPLMLAGVKRALVLYTDVNTYRHLLGQHIEASPERMSAPELYRLAQKTLQEHQETAKAAIFKEIEDAESQAKVVKDPLKLLPAVESGRVHHLILSEQETGDSTDEMLNHLAIAALRRRSSISVIGTMPVPNGYAAGILRYGRESLQAS